MKKALLLLLPCILLCCTANTQTKNRSASSSQKSLLWEVSGNGLISSSYLFGTYHFEGKSFADSLKGIGEKFKTCKAVAEEVVIDSSSFEVIGPAMRFTDTTLDKIFTQNEYDSIATCVKSFSNVKLDKISHLRPSALELYLLSFLTPKTISDTNPELDKYFRIEGEKNKDKIIGLETVQFQIDMVFNAPLEDQKRRLLFCMREMDAARKNINDYHSMYRQQDIEGLYKMLMYTDREYSKAEKDKMLKNRNLKWMEKLRGIIKDQPTFIAVSAGHLMGEHGLIHLLRLKGYTVTPVKI
jgi:uncharacterized protein YbaP (TraB family)